MDTATPLPPFAPPTSPAPLAIAPRCPVWPIVLGVTLIVFGAGGLLINLWGAIAGLFLSEIIASLAANTDPAAAEQVRTSMRLGGVVSLVGLPIAGLLLASGIGMVNRRPWSPRTAAVWAVLKIIIALVPIVLTLFIQQEQPNTLPPGVSKEFMATMQTVGVALTVLWSVALPIFTLVWLRLRFVRDEIATWSAPPPAGSLRDPGTLGLPGAPA